MPGISAAFLLGLQIVDVHAVAVDMLADRMPGPVDELRAVSGVPHHRLAGVVHFPAVAGSAFGEPAADEGHGRVARVAHDAEDLHDTSAGGSLPTKPHQVMSRRSRRARSSFAQRSISSVSPLPIGRAFDGVGSKCGIRRMLVRADDGEFVHAGQPLLAEAPDDEPLDVVLGQRPPGAQLGADEGERLVLDSLDALAGFQVRLVAASSEDRLERLHQVGRGNHFVAERRG